MREEAKTQEESKQFFSVLQLHLSEHQMNVAPNEKRVHTDILVLYLRLLLVLFTLNRLCVRYEDTVPPHFAG